MQKTVDLPEGQILSEEEVTQLSTMVEELVDRFTGGAGVGQLLRLGEEIFDDEWDVGERERGLGHGRNPLSVVGASCGCGSSSGAAAGVAMDSHSPMTSGPCCGGTIRPCGSRTWTGST